MNIGRRIAERMLGSLVLHRRLPDDAGAGPIVVSGQVGGLKYLFKKAASWDPELVSIARLLVQPGDAVWDVGANVGLFSRAASYFAGSGGMVASIEADLDALSLLHKTSRHPAIGHADMVLVPVAINDSNGFVRFEIARRARAANAIHGFGSTQMGGVKESRIVPCVTLDYLLDHFVAPKVLKIDVEGAEIAVLAGADTTLGRARPAVYCEIGKATWQATVGTLVKRQYRCVDGRAFVCGELCDVTASTTNMVAIPDERWANLLGYANGKMRGMSATADA